MDREASYCKRFIISGNFQADSTIRGHMSINVGLVDDDQLLVGSLTLLIDNFSSFKVIIGERNGERLLQKLETLKTPLDIMLIDVNMPVMDGPATAKAIAKKYPLVKLVALSMKDDDSTILSMLNAGCCAYLVKDMNPIGLEKALNEIYTVGYYYGDLVNVNYRRLLNKANEEAESTMKDSHLAFLKLACSDLTYKQIASQMHLAERTIDGYREELFQIFDVKSRTGMVLEALRRKLITL
jgi:DNA-binding NarL/FixJ family response regulator